VQEKNRSIYGAGYHAGLQAAHGSRNQAAFVIGIIAGFFGIWGLSYILNNKVGTGCLWMLIVGPVLAALLGGLIVATGGVGAIVIFPLWLYIVYVQAKNGASNI